MVTSFPRLMWQKRKPVLLPLLMSASIVLTCNLLGILDSVQNYPGLLHLNQYCHQRVLYGFRLG